MAGYTEADWIDHCDPPCGLGQFRYACPECGKETYDCELWWKHDDYKAGFAFRCSHCGIELHCKWDENEAASLVRKTETESEEGSSE